MFYVPRLLSVTFCLYLLIIKALNFLDRCFERVKNLLACFLQDVESLNVIQTSDTY